MRLCQFFCCGGKANLVRIFLLNPRIFFLYYLLCMDLQPYSHDCFSKNIKNFVWFPKQYLLGFFFLEKFLTGVSCFSVTLFCSTLLALTHRQNYGQRNEYTRFAWAGGPFFIITTGKKSSSRLSGGCMIVITTGKKKVLVVCLAGARSLLRPKKRSSSRLSGGCAIVITTGKKVLVVCLAGAWSLLQPKKRKF